MAQVVGSGTTATATLSKMTVSEPAPSQVNCIPPMELRSSVPREESNTGIKLGVVLSPEAYP